MRNLLLALATFSMSLPALADGWVCEDSELKVIEYNYLSPSDGTRNARIMILVNKNFKEDGGKRTIAVFDADTNSVGGTVLSQDGATYTGDVDLRKKAFIKSKYEYIPNKDGVGARIENTETVTLAVDFTYGDNLAAGQTTSAQFIVDKRNGEDFTLDLTCTRYLKGESKNSQEELIEQAYGYLGQYATQQQIQQ